VRGLGRVEHGQSAFILGVRASDVEVDFEPGFSNLSITFEPNVIRDQLRAMVGVENVNVALEAHLDLRSGGGMYLQRLAHLILAEVERCSGKLNPSNALIGLREGFIHALLAAQLRTSAFDQPTLDVGERRVRILEDYIEEHLTEALTLGELAAQAGVSTRAVQLAFRRCRDLSPASFIRGRRLERAAKLLRAGAGSTTILDVALECGFSHMGRFAQSYRERFGELPSETLRRS